MHHLRFRLIPSSFHSPTFLSHFFPFHILHVGKEGGADSGAFALATALLNNLFDAIFDAMRLTGGQKEWEEEHA